MKKKALIFGISGQDGAYLARTLLKDGYAVFGASRDREAHRFDNLRRLGVYGELSLISSNPADLHSVFQTLKDVEPDEIFNLAGQSSVGLSFDQPADTLNSLISGPLNILEGIRLLKLKSRLYNACSSECFGNVVSGAADETTPFNPRSPYGVGKAAAYWTVANYRDAYDLFAASGILFNHESPLRPSRFVTQKIIKGAADIAEGKSESLKLGDLNGERDFGWAPEYVEAMALMIRQETPADYVICTGVSAKLGDFVDSAFSWFGLDWTKHVQADSTLRRPSDISRSVGNPERAARELGWRAKTKMPDLVGKLADAELRLRRGEKPV